MMTNLFYSRQDVEDASWILSTMHTLNHGLMSEIWATKVIAWYYNFMDAVRKRVESVRLRGISTPIKELFTETVQLIKNGVLIINPIMLMQ